MEEDNLLGNSGEIFITNLCSDDNLVCNNSSSNDRKGWDLLIEFQDDSVNKSLPLDRKSMNIECRLQVKSTESVRKEDFSITLKNMYNLINHKYPVFFCRCYYIKHGSSRAIDKVAIKHLDGDLIERSLKRIRELEKEDKLNLLNKRKITFSHSDEDYIEYKNGRALREKILSVVKNIDEYCIWKDEIRLGNSIQVMNFSFSPETQQTDIRDNFLGGKENLYVNKIKIYDERFGIKLPLKDFNEALFDFRSKPEKVNVYVSLGKYSSEKTHILFDYKSTLNAGPLLEKEFHIVLFTFKAISIKLDLLNPNISINLSERCSYTIEDFRHILDFLIIVKKSYSEKKIYVSKHI